MRHCEGDGQAPIISSPETRLATTRRMRGVVVTAEAVRTWRFGVHGDQLIAVMPAEVDFTNSGQIRDVLLRALNSGVRTLIVDMSGTGFCDVSGMRTLERVYQRARACDAQLRLVVTASIVRRMLIVNGLHRIIAVYPSVAAALPDPHGPRRARVLGRAGPPVCRPKDRTNE
jgi:anti-sigma B factor antagonist